MALTLQVKVGLWTPWTHKMGVQKDFSGTKMHERPSGWNPVLYIHFIYLYLFYLYTCQLCTEIYRRDLPVLLWNQNRKVFRKQPLNSWYSWYLFLYYFASYQWIKIPYFYLDIKFVGAPVIKFQLWNSKLIKTSSLKICQSSFVSTTLGKRHLFLSFAPRGLVTQPSTALIPSL